jgi:2-dehydropantoate 2-reductase
MGRNGQVRRRTPQAGVCSGESSPRLPALGSIRRGERTEIDYLNGEIVALGQRTGRPTPYNGAVVDLVHQVE